MTATHSSVGFAFIRAAMPCTSGSALAPSSAELASNSKYSGMVLVPPRSPRTVSCVAEDSIF